MSEGDEPPGDEPVFTGWLQTQLSGDIDTAQSHRRAGRRILGQLLVNHGVNARIAAGQPGGYFKTVKLLEDGTRVTAWHNNGQNVLRIEAPRAPRALPERPIEAPQVAPWQGEAERAGRRQLSHTDPHAEVPPPTWHTIEEEDEPDEEVESSEYLWVGVRVKDGCTRPHYALDVHLVEPEGGQLADGSAARGIVGVAFSGSNGWADSIDFTAAGSQQDSWTLTPSPFNGAHTTSIAALFQEMWEDWGEGTFAFSPNMLLGDHQVNSCIAGTGLDDGGQFDGGQPTINWSVNGLTMQYWLDNPQDFGPFDPLMDDQENAGGARTFDGLTTPFGNPPPSRFGWDAVFCLDPDYEDFVGAGAMADDRPLMLAFRRYLTEHQLMQPQVLDGVYKLAVRAYDTPPDIQSSRSGEEIGLPLSRWGLGPNGEPFMRSGGCDYRDYMQPVNEWPPLEVEVEIRIGRDEFGAPEQIFNFELTCAQYDERESITWPFGVFGSFAFDPCGAEGGPNMGGPSFSQWIDIDVRGGSAELSDQAPTRVFATAPYAEYVGERRNPARFFIYGSVFPAVSDSDWEAFAGQALFEACEAVTSGAFGCSEMSARSAGELATLFAGTSKANVYMYDPEAGTLTNLGPPTTTPADWAVNSPPDDSFNFFWYYENAVPYQNECFNTYGVLVTSVGGFYEMSQNFGGTPGYVSNPNCC